MMAKNVTAIPPEDAGSVRRRMQELEALLREVEAFLATFGQKGWLKRAWSLRTGAATLTDFDRKIGAKLVALKDLYRLAQDAHVTRLLTARPYPLEVQPCNLP